MARITRDEAIAQYPAEVKHLDSVIPQATGAPTADRGVKEFAAIVGIGSLAKREEGDREPISQGSLRAYYYQQNEALTSVTVDSTVNLAALWWTARDYEVIS